VKEIFNICRSESGRQFDNLFQINVPCIELGEVILKDSFPPRPIHAAYRNDAVESSRTKHGGIQLPDMIRGTYQQYLVPLTFQQRNLF
jgi:hypothetical protein